ncbi:MAG: glycine betaine ABC transporter substrate-binding protein [Pseudomonadota bacterium]
MNRCARYVILIASLAICSSAHPSDEGRVIGIASKNFTENYILAEIAAQYLEYRGVAVRRQFGLGGTKVCFEALQAGEVDFYPEYSGTIQEVILQSASGAPLAEQLLALELQPVAPLGFNNTYVLAMRTALADELNVSRISDLAGKRGLNIALSHEFRARNDGWPALAAHYGLALPNSGIEHGLAYQALANGRIDVTDAYSTDGELSTAALTLLEDDLAFFPRYDALWLARDDLPPQVASYLADLAGRINEEQMQALNARAAIDGDNTASIARDFLRAEGLVSDRAASHDSTLVKQLIANTWRHLQLTGAALFAAALAGIALAFLVQPHRRASAALLYVCGLMQTIPSIALLALMIPLLGIGVLPAIVALFLYALLPVVRATLTAINAIDNVHITVATALGMNRQELRRHVLLPLAMPHIIAGLRTAAVISIGTATLAAFIGAGGLGQPIVTGLALNDSSLILQGAIPAALLAIITDLGFDALERRLVAPHMRRSSSGG